MPLPSVTTYGALQCKAKAKHTGCRCLNPAAYGMVVCRYHGARRTHTILKGGAHPAFIHGEETLAAKAARAASAAEMRELERLAHLLNMTTAKKMPGRKPKAEATQQTRAVLQLAIKMHSQEG